jgi:hypothetical protein
VGSKVTLMAQFDPAATELPHVFVSAKSAPSAPLIVMPLRLSAPLPVLDTFTDCAALLVPKSSPEKATLLGDTATTGVPEPLLPVPLRETVCVPAPSATLSVAVSPPVMEGVKVTAIVHVPPLAATEALVEQVVPLEGIVKSPAFVPVNDMLLIVSAELVLFVSVTVCAALVVPTVWPAKARLDGLTFTPAAAAPLIFVTNASEFPVPVVSKAPAVVG